MIIANPAQTMPKTRAEKLLGVPVTGIVYYDFTVTFDDDSNDKLIVIDRIAIVVPTTYQSKQAASYYLLRFQSSKGHPKQTKWQMTN